MANRTSTPRAIDVSRIKGNVSEDEKISALKIFSHFVDKSYGDYVGRRLELVEVNVWGKSGPAASAETVFEIDVAKDMCNIFGNLHGGCAAYMVDPCSVSSLVVLGNATGVDGSGVSQSMNLIWHQPARAGDKLRIVSTSVFIHGRVRSARCEIWNGEKLCVSAVHSTINPRKKKNGQDTEKGKL
ncbi:hypothetical protein DXG03_007622 [Asterophora parasitica]|uniref:Thioesterase domain-containing protein n=1 Tax=Asterophora parasitica TaxID=117018 RepID=A0A9P7GCJ7_9AGAR|nr:hypothetical protein DXG03_007622 [Asterophora parasitica]